MKRKKSSNKALFIVIFIVLIIAIVILNKEKIVKIKPDQSGENNNIAQDDSSNQNDVQINTQDKNDEKNDNDIQNDVNDNNSNQKNTNKEDEQTPEDINYMEMSYDNKISSSFILGEFNNGKELSTEQYLKVVYNALNKGYISSNKTNYSEEEINNIVYSIFNVKLNEHKSIEGLTYTQGIYTLKKTESPKIELSNVQKDVAAGNTYVEFDVNGTSYIAKLGTNTLTGETYIISIIED